MSKKSFGGGFNDQHAASCVRHSSLRDLFFQLPCNYRALIEREGWQPGRASVFGPRMIYRPSFLDFLSSFVSNLPSQLHSKLPNKPNNLCSALIGAKIFFSSLPPSFHVFLCDCFNFYHQPLSIFFFKAFFGGVNLLF